MLPERLPKQSHRLFLSGKTIGLSVSESDDLLSLGLSAMHLKDLMIEICRYIFSFDATIAYGGDLRYGGFTRIFFDLSFQYKSQISTTKRVKNYLSWPYSLDLTSQLKAEMKPVVSFHEIPPPDNVIIDRAIAIKPDTDENRTRIAICLTTMRKEMESNCQARIFAGGKLKNFSGKIPGILEEFLIAMDQRKPVYLIGAYGGVVAEIINCLRGSSQFNLVDSHLLKDPSYHKFINYFNSWKRVENIDRIDYSSYIHLIQKIGMQGISNLNGLSIEENERLAVTPHVLEAVSLILTGLRRLFSKDK